MKRSIEVGKRTKRVREIKNRVLAGVAAATLSVAGCSKHDEKDPRIQTPSVTTFKVQESGDTHTDFTGIVAPRVQSDLGFRVGGKILERLVNMGQRVRKGEILMKIDPVDLNLASTAQQANVEAARASYALAKADEGRLARLVKSGAISLQEYDQAKAALDSAKANLEASEAQARVSDNAKDYAVLKADTDGVIVRTLSEPGQVVAAGQTVLQLAHDGPREAIINLPEGVRPQLGSSAEAELYGITDVYPAKLRELSNSADPMSRTFEARYVLEGDAANAPLGSTVTLTLATPKVLRGKSVVVPIAAVYDRGSGPGVWVVDGKSEVRFRPVTISSVGQEEIILSDGVSPDESVVALGAHLLHEGQAVNANNGGAIVDAKF